MATLYVSSVDGDNSDDGSTWALAKATVAGALTLCTDATNIVYVDSAHAAVPAAAIAWNITTSRHVAIISVDRNGSSTTGHNGWLAGASETVSTNAAAFDICTTGAQFMFIYGMSIIGNNGSSTSNIVSIGTSTSNSRVELQSCVVNSPTTANIGAIRMGGTLSKVEATDCTLTLHVNTGVGHGVDIRGPVTLNNCTIAVGASQPSALFRWTGGAIGQLIANDCNLSAYTVSGGNIVYPDEMNAVSFAVLTNCKIHGTPTRVKVGAWGSDSASVTLMNVSASDTFYEFEYYTKLGKITANTSIYANDGATRHGTNLSWKVETTAACWEGQPFTTPWLYFVSPQTSSITASVELDFDNATDLNNRTCWMRTERISDASFPLGTLETTRHANPFDGSGANLTSSALAWTGTGGFANEKKRKIEETFTPSEKSTLRANLNFGVASWTGYVDPYLRGVA
jgi:hypothetical protein